MAAVRDDKQASVGKLSLQPPRVVHGHERITVARDHQGGCPDAMKLARREQPLGRDVGGAGERVTVTTLAALDPEQVDMRTLVIVGASTTQVVRRGDRDVVFTPRHYRRGG